MAKKLSKPPKLPAKRTCMAPDKTGRDLVHHHVDGGGGGGVGSGTVAWSPDDADCGGIGDC